MSKGSGCESRRGRGVRLYMRRGGGVEVTSPESGRTEARPRGQEPRARRGERDESEARETRNELGFGV